MSRNKGPGACYVVAWPDELILKAGVSCQRRWLSFIGYQVVLIHEAGAASYDVEAIAADIIRRHGGTNAFDTAADAIPYLAGHGGGYLECLRLPDEDAFWAAVDELRMPGALLGALPGAIR